MDRGVVFVVVSCSVVFRLSQYSILYFVQLFCFVIVSMLHVPCGVWCGLCAVSVTPKRLGHTFAYTVLTPSSRRTPLLPAHEHRLSGL